MQENGTYVDNTYKGKKKERNLCFFVFVEKRVVAVLNWDTLCILRHE